MADTPKEGESFFRKVVRFVANPATDWADLNSRQPDNPELELEKSELKAMVERKRRNDFVRRREFDTLRKLRREGLSAEQLAALGAGNRDDSEPRVDGPGAATAEAGVKAKIDAIEQQMVGDTGAHAATTPRRPPEFFAAPTEPAVLPRTAGMPPLVDAAVAAPVALPPLPPMPASVPRTGAPMPPAVPRSERGEPAAVSSTRSAGLPKLDLDFDLPAAAPSAPTAPRPVPSPMPARAPAAAQAAGGGGLGPLAPMTLTPANQSGSHHLNLPFAVEVSEVVLDPELDEAVIAFANADFEACERSLTQLTSANGRRAQHAETWLVLFDLFRATGNAQRFESLALEYAQRFGWSAPQWFSLPQLVSEAAAQERPKVAKLSGEVGWVAPDHMDVEAVMRLRSQTLQMPLPWVFDWAGLKRFDAEAATHFSALLRVWSGQALEMQWIAADRLFGVLAEAAPTGVRDADPAFWLTRLDALRLVNRADQFDETAIDYCVTYEVSPPSWEPARCNVKLSGVGFSTRPPALSIISEVSTGFMESGLIDDGSGTVQVASLELSGQLVGDIGSTLGKLNTEIGMAPMVSVSCAKLIRVDFLAAGDLLNWVLSKRNENRAVHFVDAHRLVALFFGAMGINEHAKVQVRKV
jgi:hypothetical protein